MRSHDCFIAICWVLILYFSFLYLMIILIVCRIALHIDKTKVCATNGLVICNEWDLEPLDQLKGLALGYYQPLPEVWVESYYSKSLTLLTSYFNVNVLIQSLYLIYWLKAGFYIIHILTPVEKSPNKYLVKFKDNVSKYCPSKVVLSINILKIMYFRIKVELLSVLMQWTPCIYINLLF